MRDKDDTSNPDEVQQQILRQLKRTNRFLSIFAGLVLASLIGVIVALVMMILLVRSTIETISSLPDRAGDATTEQICESPLSSVIGGSEFCSDA